MWTSRLGGELFEGTVDSASVTSVDQASIAFDPATDTSGYFAPTTSALRKPIGLQHSAAGAVGPAQIHSSDAAPHWIVEIELSDSLVATGFELTETRMRELLANAVPHGHVDGLRVRVVSSPAPEVTGPASNSEIDRSATTTRLPFIVRRIGGPMAGQCDHRGANCEADIVFQVETSPGVHPRHVCQPCIDALVAAGRWNVINEP